MTTPTDRHGGNLDDAVRQFGGRLSDWLDLSTGINRHAYPSGDISLAAWRDLPTATRHQSLLDAASRAYQTSAPVAAVAGAQTAIQILPTLWRPGRAAILGPTYSEFRASFLRHGWSVDDGQDPAALEGATQAIVVNPNNPTGRVLHADLLFKIAATVELLIVDESFADTDETTSLASRLTGTENILVIRSFGKFFGLAGLRLGFVLGHTAAVDHIRAAAGPWPVSGPACDLGRRALGDDVWQKDTCRRLAKDARRMDGLARSAGWSVAGGTHLFRLYATQNARAAQRSLAARRVWSRIFPSHEAWLRLGLPGNADEWHQAEMALENLC